MKWSALTPRHLERSQLLKPLAGLIALTFLLRIFYLGHIYADDGLWFTAAEEVLQGKALYREIYFDKPPGLPLVYAFLFWIFGSHIVVIRLFTIVYSVAISGVLYRFGSGVYDGPTGILAAFLFAVCSTTYAPHHMHSLHTDFLMALPYTAGAYLLTRSITRRLPTRVGRSQDLWPMLIGSALLGIAFQFNPKALFGLLFYALLLFIHRWFAHQPMKLSAEGSRIWRSVTLAGIGFTVGTLPMLAYLVLTKSFLGYVDYVWSWGLRYAEYNPIWRVFINAIRFSVGYFSLNPTLLFTFAFFTAATVQRIRGALKGGYPMVGEGFDRARKAEPASPIEADVALLVWFLVSYAGVTVGGRFSPNYFFQILPSLCLIAARGLREIKAALKDRSPSLRRGAVALLTIGFVFTLVRFHSRTVVLAIDSVKKTESEAHRKWDLEVWNQHQLVVAALVREFSYVPDPSDNRHLEALRTGGPRTRPPNGDSDYLFVWGYEPAIYFWSGLLPASHYLSSQPLTGVPADVHYFKWGRPILDPKKTAAARARLVCELQQTPPKYIVDALELLNGDYAMTKYPELGAFLKNYESIAVEGPFRIYCRKDPQTSGSAYPN